jgi:DNA-binding NarL/FixJ family response regulator
MKAERWTNEEVATLRRMLRAGKSHAEIGRALNRSTSSVKNKAISQAVFNDQPKIDLDRRQSA